MKYLICCSKKWFFLNCKNSFKNKKNIHFIFNKKQLNLKFLKKYNPKIIFFLIGATLSLVQFTQIILVYYFTLQIYLMGVVGHLYKI